MPPEVGSSGGSEVDQICFVFAEDLGRPKCRPSLELIMHHDISWFALELFARCIRLCSCQVCAPKHAMKLKAFSLIKTADIRRCESYFKKDQDVAVQYQGKSQLQICSADLSHAVLIQLGLVIGKAAWSNVLKEAEVAEAPSC